MSHLSIRSKTVFILLTVNALVHGFYVYHDDNSFNENENQEIINDFNIVSKNENSGNNEFPSHFDLHFSTFGANHKIKFKRNDNLNHNADIFTVEKDQVVQYKPQERLSIQSYEEYEGLSVVTLIKNNDLNEADNVHYENQYRFLGRIHPNNESHFYDINPILLKKGTYFEKRKRSIAEINSKHTHEQYHSVQRRNGSDHNYGQDYTVINRTIETHHAHKRANANGQPNNLFVEMLVVTDQSVYADQQRFANTNNQDLVFLHMRVYFAHHINICNSRYLNSLKNDPDLRINIQIISFLFLTTYVAWTDPSIVGVSGIPTYEGRQVIAASQTLNGFATYMNSLSLPFSYDHAMGFFNKDLWASTSDTPQMRSGVVGYSYILGVCSINYKFSISEEIGGFYYASVVAHELGHCLGSQHDSEPGIAIAANCPQSDNYIMTPTSGAYTNNLLNQFLFSNCSILQFKKGLLTQDLSSASSNAQCLSNIPVNIPFETKILNLSQPGAIWTADDQCKMIYGQNNGSFCHGYSNSICTSLACRTSAATYQCQYVPGIGAVDGTPCGSGKSCLQGQCVVDSKVPTSSCLYGDDLVSRNDILNVYQFPVTLMTCTDAILTLNASQADFIFFCQNSQFPFSSACCDTCSKYTSITCIDQYYYCGQYAKYCNQGVTFQTGVNLDVACPYTCGTCKRSSFTCATSASWCLNGATCVNTVGMSSNFQLIGFTCSCLTGYSGQFCQTVNPCLVNGGPCMNGGSCQRIGSFSYACLCNPQFTGIKCETFVASGSTIITAVFSSTTQSTVPVSFSTFTTSTKLNPTVPLTVTSAVLISSLETTVVTESTTPASTTATTITTVPPIIISSSITITIAPTMILSAFFATIITKFL